MLNGNTAEPIVLEFLDVAPGGVMFERRVKLAGEGIKSLTCELSGDLDQFKLVNIDVQVLDDQKRALGLPEARLTSSQRSTNILNLPNEAKFVDFIAKCAIGGNKIEEAKLVINCKTA